MGLSDDPAIEAEVIEMLDWYLKELKITNTTLLINSVGEPASRAAYIETLRQAIMPKLDQLCGDCHHRRKPNPLRVFDCKVESCQAIIADLPVITDSLTTLRASTSNNSRRIWTRAALPIPSTREWCAGWIITPARRSKLPATTALARRTRWSVEAVTMDCQKR